MMGAKEEVQRLLLGDAEDTEGVVVSMTMFSGTRPVGKIAEMNLLRGRVQMVGERAGTFVMEDLKAGEFL